MATHKVTLPSGNTVAVIVAKGQEENFAQSELYTEIIKGTWRVFYDMYMRESA